LREIGRRLEQMRKDKGLSRREVAEHLGTTIQSIYNWERHRGGRMPPYEALFAMVELYQRHIGEVFGIPDPKRVYLRDITHQLPDDLAEWVCQEGSEEFLLMAREIDENNIDPDFIRGIINIMRAQKRHQNEEGDT